jgi:hypothetical protein
MPRPSLFVFMTALPIALATLAGSPAAHAAPPLAQNCLAGSAAACERLHFYHYVLPHAQRDLSSFLSTPVALIPIPICAPVGCPESLGIDRDYLIEHARILEYLRTRTGDPNPEPSYPVPLVTTKPVSVADQLKGARALRDAMQLSLDHLDRQIATLQASK